MNDCPYCHAPAPIAGELEHAWDCDRPPYGRYLRHPPHGWIDDGKSPEEARAALIAIARRTEAAWAKRAARRKTTTLVARNPLLLST